MNDYDYLNARVRGMSTLLLTPDFYDQVLGAAADNVIVDALLASSYAEVMREALAARAGAPAAFAVEAAARSSAHAALAKVLAIAPPEPRRLLALQINRWDVANIMALLRGKLAGAGPRDVLAAVLPIGELDEIQLGELAAEADVENVADALTTWKHGFAFALRRAIRECRRQDDPVSLERALYRGWFQWALSQLSADNPQHSPVRDMLRRQIDLANVLALLATIRDRERTGSTEACELIPGGKLPERITAELAACDSLEGAFETLETTYFAPGIEKGILAYGQARSLAVMERFLEAVIIEQGCRLFRRDMLSIAVPLGFIWRAYSELVNLRLLARGAVYRMPANAMREGMIIV
jgi:V/A-type H+-transporting ATPase subunit C